MARHKLVPGPIDIDVFGWELRSDEPYLIECHETFSASNERDLAMAKRWANDILGRRHTWRKVTEHRGGFTFEHYEAGAE
jgi:hypothetical protein